MRVVIDSSVIVVVTPNPESVAAALAGRAAFVVTLDRHLLALDGLPGLRIERPGDFLRELRRQH